MEHEGDSDTNYSWHTRNGHQRKTEEIKNQRKNQNPSDYSIIEIGLNTKKGPEDLRILDVI